MALSPGRRLGPYEVISPIGAGGMGEIYKARDARLNRFVAIKVLPEEVASDPDRLRRFEQEARAASALNHPNIVTVHDVGVCEATSYLAMELVEGKTLRDVLLRGPLPTKKLLELAVQIADGLAAAHEAGIVHRDLKPRNVIVTRDGRVKIVDFGLAKMPRPAILAAASSETTTLTGGGTLSGEVVGTVEYMSPEQARGKALDFRSDQFSFGTVLYEMATGKHAFGRATPADTLAAILREDPEPLAAAEPPVPPPLRWIIERCLAKDPGERYSSTRDLARELRVLRDHLGEISAAFPAAQPAAKSALRLVPLAAAIVAAAVALGVWLLAGRNPKSAAQPDFRRLTFRDGVVSRALFVPNSNSILYTAAWDGQPSASYLTLQQPGGRDRPLEAEVQLPMAYSQDGSQVLVLLGVSRPAINARGTLAWWPTLGGRARRLLDDAGWSDWADENRLLAVARDAGSARVLEIRDAKGNLLRTIFRTAGAINYVRVSPDERRVAFIHHPSRSDDAGEIDVANVDGSGSKALTRSFLRCAGLDWNKRTGEIWFTASMSSEFTSTLASVRESRTWRVLHSFPEPMVLQRISSSGDRVLLTSGDTRANLTVLRQSSPARDLSWLGWSVAADISPDGKSLLFMDGGTSEGASGMFLRPLEGEGTVRLGDGEPGAFSPDGRWVIGLTSPVAGPQQLVVVPVEAGKPRQLTSTKSSYATPSFADASTILFVRSEQANHQIWRMQLDGSGLRSLGISNCDLPRANPAGGSLLCRGGDSKGALFLYPIDGSGRGRKLYQLPAGDYFHSARWNREGDRVLAVAKDGTVLVVNASTGELLRRETPPAELADPRAFLIAGVLNADATIRAYSIARSSSALYFAPSPW